MTPAFHELPLGAIRPRGWLRDQLRLQADGQTGQLGDVWPAVGPDSGWLGGSGESDGVADHPSELKRRKVYRP